MISYHADVVAWAQEQARLLREGQFGALDIEHLAEEIEDVGKSEKRELRSRMTILLAHLRGKMPLLAVDAGRNTMDPNINPGFFTNRFNVYFELAYILNYCRYINSCSMQSNNAVL